MYSIAKRIRRTYFLMSLCIISVMVTILLLVNEDLERTMLELDVAEERNFFLGHRAEHEELFWESSTLVAQYIPDSQLDQSPPAIFAGLPDQFSGEIERNGKTYLADVGRDQNGRFYVAKEITRFEERETLFSWILAAVSLSILVLSFVLAYLSSRRLVKPLQQLTEQIRTTPVGPQMPRLELKYQDAELHAIAETFNQFLAELEAFVKREHSLVNLASHELRTPVAVIAGALDVLEQRQQLQPNDQATLARVRRATKEMEENVAVLLKLARRSEIKETRMNLLMPALLEEVLEDLSTNFDVYQRVKLSIGQNFNLTTDPVLAKMLIRNLIQNALQHTTREVSVNLQPDMLEIADEGTGLSPEQQAILFQGVLQRGESLGLSGLGLYIATMMCERLQWRLQSGSGAEHGTVIQLVFHPG